ncbi:MAG: DNA translocase FtsK 4TM domain-containing protein [Chloroflexi bacterium]|nr:DNA translocase FtsK 4TM domain-containing protein [Chloroflexota bacterium]
MARRKGKKPGLLDISPKIWAETAGIVLLAVAAVTILSLLSLTRGTLTERWLHLLEQSFGLGAYLVPFGAGALGFWLFLRGFERQPAIPKQRAFGVILLFVASLALIHLLSFPSDPAKLAAEGGGGGYLGWFVSETLVDAVGGIGASLVLLLLASTGVILCLGVSTLTVGVALRGAWAQLTNWWHLAQDRFSRASQPPRDDSVAARVARISERRAPEPGTEGVVTEARAVPPVTDETQESMRGLLFPRIIGGPPEWHLPAIEEIFEESVEHELSQAEIRFKVRVIEETLASFGVPAKVVEVNQGPTVTQFGVEPGFVERRDRQGKIQKVKVKVNRISALSKDLSLALAAAPIRIEAPVPGRSIIGIEVPNTDVSLVSLRSVIESEAFRKIDSKLRIALGQDVAGQPVAADLGQMPHLLIAGATGSGKSVCINSIIACLLAHNTPDDLRMIMIDPKMVELTNFNGIPHLLAPVVVEIERVVSMLKWATQEMDRRYRLFSRRGVRNIEMYNQVINDQGGEKLPYIVIFIDELADLMMVAPDEVERSVCRIAQLARATGIHLVMATQRPSVDVVTGLIKANFPSRISFAVTSQVDSRVVLDAPGAEKLLGRGDMLYMPSDSSKLLRLQGCFVSDTELERLVQFWRGFRTAPTIPEGTPLVQQPLWEEVVAREKELAETDELLDEAIKIVREQKRASISLLQRRLRIGYSRAARLIDIMEERGIIGPSEGGSQPREVLPPNTNHQWEDETHQETEYR